MSIPNIGPEPPGAHVSDGAKKGNPALVYRSERPMDEVEAASTRASSVTNRFGGVRYGLNRPIETQQDGGESDPRD